MSDPHSSVFIRVFSLRRREGKQLVEAAGQFPLTHFSQPGGGVFERAAALLDHGFVSRLGLFHAATIAGDAGRVQ